MYSNNPNFPGKPMHPLGHQAHYYTQNSHMASLFDGLSNVDIQPSNACPRNFVIFDQTNNRSRIMFHPEVSSKMFYPGFGGEMPIFPEKVEQKDATDEREVTSQLKEDSADIDALLSTDYEDEESDEEVSTACTNAIYQCSSSDSCSSYESVSRKSQSSFRKSSLSHGDYKKRERVRKMVKALRGIVPGANRMSTVAVLDEAVRYLKSLRVEVKKLGVGKLNDQGSKRTTA